MEFLIIPVAETSSSDMLKIYSSLRACGNAKYASHIFSKVQVVEVSKENPYVEIEFSATEK